MQSDNQRVKDIFEAMIRFSGFVSAVYGAVFFISGIFFVFSTLSEATRFEFAMLFIPAFLLLALGVYLMRGAPLIMNFVFKIKN